MGTIFHNSYARYSELKYLSEFLELCMETPCWCPSEGHQHGGQKPTGNICHFTEFCYESVNSFLEELITMKVKLFLIQELFR